MTVTQLLIAQLAVVIAAAWMVFGAPKWPAMLKFGMSLALCVVSLAITVTIWGMSA